MILSVSRRTGASKRRVCHVLGVPRSSFYTAATESPRQAADRELGSRVEGVFNDHFGRYGYRRISAELGDQGVACPPGRTRNLMAQRGLRALQPKRHRPQTSDGKAAAPARNLLADRPLPNRTNAVWSGDITYIRTAAGWVYLAVVIDLCSRRVVGWSLAPHMRSALVCEAMENALKARKVGPGLIFHSDRGSQYGSARFRGLLMRAGASQSMSAKANPYDNAWTESFIGTLKLEHVDRGEYQGEPGARAGLFEYIDGYYNTRRKHSAIDYRTPSEHEQYLLTQN